LEGRHREPFQGSMVIQTLHGTSTAPDPYAPFRASARLDEQAIDGRVQRAEFAAMEDLAEAGQNRQLPG